MRPTAVVFLLVLALVFLLYMLVPSPSVIPALPDSLKSTEEGDTIQVPRVSAYYSQYDRAFVTKYYQNHFSQISFLGLSIKLPSYRLNHPPEFAREKIRSGIETAYFEEVVHSFRGQLFINGWQPEIDYRSNPVQLDKHRMILNGELYVSKTTLRPFYSTLIARIINYFLILATFMVVYQWVKKIIFSKNDV